MCVSRPRLPLLAASLAMALATGAPGAEAQTNPPGAVGMPTVSRATPDPVVAEVEGQTIHLSEVGDEIRAMPAGGGQNSFEALYPVALRRLIERKVLVLRGRVDGVADDPVVRRQMEEASDKVLELAYLEKATARFVTEQGLLARYDAEIAGKPGPEEVHGWAILVATEAEAQDIIAKLDAGADFATLARQFSKDATAAHGGDLGLVQRTTVVSEIAAVLFSLRTGSVTPYPVGTAVGWFVLKAGERQHAPTPSFAEARDRLEGESRREHVVPVLQAALSQAIIRAYDMNGHEVAAPDAEEAAPADGEGK